jgi:uncharacterized protein with HEPN domain
LEGDYEVAGCDTHHYLKIDVDIVYSTMKEDLPLLQATLLSMKQAILS